VAVPIRARRIEAIDEGCLTQTSKDAKKNAIKGTGWCDLREYISFSSQPEAYQDPIDFPTQRNEDAKG
jgi:hypothetical protein